MDLQRFRRIQKNSRTASGLISFGCGLMVGKQIHTTRNHMPKYVIEREIPGLGRMAPQQLRSMSQSSCAVLEKLGTKIQWLESYVTDDKLYCVYYASDEEMIRQHACEGNFPANRISEIRTVIGPATAE